MTVPVLAVRDLETSIIRESISTPVVRGVSFEIGRGETLALVGESGCGKSMTALSVLQLLPEPPCRITGGSVRLEGRELVGLPERELCRLRGRRMAMIFQDPMSTLNPVLSIGRQVAEAVAVHTACGTGAARQRAVQLLALVGLPDPALRLQEYPHRLSGGMRQRVMIAMALASDPALLVADEPTTALDVTIQAQILALLADLRTRLGLAVLFITHNLALVAEHADRVAVMYAGRVIEEGAVQDVLAAPAHPYTIGLFGARPGPRTPHAPRRRLVEIPGVVPPPHALPPGCAFAPRCPRADAACRTVMPVLAPYDSMGQFATGRLVACARVGEP